MPCSKHHGCFGFFFLFSPHSFLVQCGIIPILHIKKETQNFNELAQIHVTKHIIVGAIVQSKQFQTRAY